MTFTGHILRFVLLVKEWDFVGGEIIVSIGTFAGLRFSDMTETIFIIGTLDIGLITKLCMKKKFSLSTFLQHHAPKIGGLFDARKRK